LPIFHPEVRRQTRIQEIWNSSQKRCQASLSFSGEEILFPQASAIDLFVCTHQIPYDLYYNMVKDDAIVIVDSLLVKDLGDTKNREIFQVPIINETKKQLGNMVLTSVVVLSMTQKVTGIIGYKNMKDYVMNWAPKEYIDLNIKAIDVGRGLL
jgi:2-oxoglutarate ferredoxin oxidoreductase subunit gamma